MKCLICGVDISKPEQQFGCASHPICQSHFLSDMEWVSMDAEVVAGIESGLTFEEALDRNVAEHIKWLNEQPEAE